MTEQWFYSLNNERRGPVDNGTLKGLFANGILTPASLVWKAGMANWVPASTVDSLFTSPTEPPHLPKQPQSTSSSPATGVDPQFVYPSNPPQSEWVSLLNFLLPGVAQLLYGQVTKGITLIVIALLSAITVIGPVAVAIGTFIDAYKVGAVLKSGRPVGKWDFFPM